MSIHKPTTKTIQTKHNPEIQDTNTHNNEHTKTQYKHISNKNKSVNKGHTNPQTWTYKNQYKDISNKRTSRDNIQKHQQKLTYKKQTIQTYFKQETQKHKNNN